MSEISELKEMLRDHMEKSESTNSKTIQALARIEVHNEYTKEKLDSHGESIDKLQSAHNKQKGMIWAFGLIGLGGVAQFIKNLF